MSYPASQHLPTINALVPTINALAHEWHHDYVLLAADPGDGALRRKLSRIEEALEQWWEKRRRMLALADAAAMPVELLRDRGNTSFLTEPLHVAPVC